MIDTAEQFAADFAHIEALIESLFPKAQQQPRYTLYSALVDSFDGRSPLIYVRDAVELARADSMDGFEDYAKTLEGDRMLICCDDMSSEEVELYSHYAKEWSTVQALTWEERKP